MDTPTRPERISLQYKYIRTVPGILKLIQLVCDVVSFILGLVAPTISYTGHKGFFTFVAGLALVGTGILFLIAFINLQAVCIPERWPMIEIIWCGFIALLYLIAGIVVATVAKSNGIFGACAFFGFAAMLAYLADALNRLRLNFVHSRARRTETRTTTTTTTTAVIRQEPTY